MAKEIQKSHMEGSKMRANKPGLGTPVMNGKVSTLQSVVHSLARAWPRLKGVCLVKRTGMRPSQEERKSGPASPASSH